MLWRSVVGKLWFTILLLVSFVLFILTVLLLQFFENFHIMEAEKDLTQEATKISKVIQTYDRNVSQSIAWEMIDTTTNALVIESGKTIYSPGQTESEKLSFDFVIDDQDLARVLKEGSNVRKVANTPNLDGLNTDQKKIIVGTPMFEGSKIIGAVFLYQPLNVVGQTSKETTKIILLSAAVAIVLTTIFAFFLSSRITSPLRRMREVAFEMAKGKFDTKIPILTHDEIGELALAFNRMGRQLEFHITALNQEKEQLSSILRSMADGVLTMNRKGEILLSNPPANRFLDYLHYSQGNVDHKSENLPTEIQTFLGQVLKLEKEQDFEMEVQGRSYVILMTPLYGQKNVRGAVAVLRDMTEERRLDKLRKDFIANVSHELRTPISMLQGYSEAIVDDIASTEQEKKEIAQVILDESLRMGRLVNELLDIARMEAGHIQLYRESVLVEEFLSRVIRKFHGLAKEQKIHLISNINIDVESIQFDSDRIEQVLTNLIDNAIRHTEIDGTVKIIAKTTNQELKVDVCDSGSGIPKEDLPFVFERFYKADKARTRGRSGTGLGLAIVKNIVEAHNGRVSVHSNVGEGTTFTFTIPI